MRLFYFCLGSFWMCHRALFSFLEETIVLVVLTWIRPFLIWLGEVFGCATEHYCFFLKGSIVLLISALHVWARVHWCCWRWSVLGCVGNLFVVQMVWFGLHPLQQWSIDPGSYSVHMMPFFSVLAMSTFKDDVPQWQSPGQCCFAKKMLWACVCTLYDIMLHYMTWKTLTSDIGIFTYGIN